MIGRKDEEISRERLLFRKRIADDINIVISNNKNRDISLKDRLNMISHQKIAQTSAINYSTHHRSIHSNDLKISEQVNKFIEINLSEQYPPFIEE